MGFWDGVNDTGRFVVGFFEHATNMDWTNLFWCFWIRDFQFCFRDEPDFFFKNCFTIELEARSTFYFPHSSCVFGSSGYNEKATLSIIVISSRSAVYARFESHRTTTSTTHIVSADFFHLHETAILLRICDCNEIKIYGFGTFLILQRTICSWKPRKRSFDWIWI